METKGNFHTPVAKEGKTENPLAIYFKEYTNECRFCRHLSVETIRGYEAVFTLFLKIMPEVSDMIFLTPEMVVLFFQRLATREREIGNGAWKTGVRESTLHTYRSKLNVFFSWLKEKSYLKENPLSKIVTRKPQLEDIRQLEETDIRKLYSAIALHSPNTFILRRDTAMVSLLTFTGIRLGEFISLEIRDIDFERQILFVRSESSKSKRSRCIPMHHTLQLHLRDYMSERNKRKYKTQFLIASSSGDTNLSRHGLKHWVKSLGTKASVKFHLHQFRHAFACNLAKKNVNVVKIQKLLGHSSLNMTVHYLQSIGTEDLQDDVNKISI